MKILIYCQHVLGLGHYFRTLEICRALDRHDIVMIAGGPPVDAVLPPNLREIRLPPLMMDQDFRSLLTETGKTSVDTVKKDRRQLLFKLYKQQCPEVLLVELYPFGRRSFAFEIDPVLKGIRRGVLKPALVVCSLRDILVRRKRNYQAVYERRVVDALNQYFDALMVHADPTLLTLDQTFGRTPDIAIPVVYTGFVTPPPPVDARRRIRARLGLKAADKLIVASLGGGKVGEQLLTAVIAAYPQMRRPTGTRLLVFTGPFMDPDTYAQLASGSSERVQIKRFASDFISYLAAADLSVSMGGYNTCMNILAARTPALVWPFSQNWEQRIRAERLADIGAMRILENADLAPPRLAAIMDRMLSASARTEPRADLDGAAATARWIEKRIAQETP